MKFPIEPVMIDRNNQIDGLGAMAQHINMKTPDQTVVIGAVRITVKDEKLYIYPSRAPSGAPVAIDAKRLESWAKRIYREEVMK